MCVFNMYNFFMKNIIVVEEKQYLKVSTKRKKIYIHIFVIQTRRVQPWSNLYLFSL